MAIERRVDGFIWLARHPRKAEILAYVRGATDSAPQWLKVDRVWKKVWRDRQIWKAAHPKGGEPPSLREIADGIVYPQVKVSYQMVANVLAVYGDEKPPETPEDTERLKLHEVAPKVLTRAVIDRYDRGELTPKAVAKLIGNGADRRNAVYWIKTMREQYEREDADRKPKRK